MTDQTGTSETTATPLLSVLHGDPSDEELAALVAVITARRAAGADRPPPSDSSAWSAPSRRLRPPMYPGGDGWWRSSNPR
jgi:hypothetical protein